MNRHGTKSASLALLSLVAGCTSLPPGPLALEPHHAVVATRATEAVAPIQVANAVSPRETSVTWVRLDSAGYWTLTRETMP